MVVQKILLSRSFSPLRLSQKCSQLIHKGFVSASPAGLRLETAFKIDKKKNEKKEFYFSSPTKMFLTRKRTGRVQKKQKGSSTSILSGTKLTVIMKRVIDSHPRGQTIPDLTELLRARTFPTSIVPLGWRSKCG